MFLVVQRITLTFTAISALITCLLYISWLKDSQRLSELAFEYTSGTSSDAERIIKLTEWVYSNQGFGKNTGYFLLKKLGPTPIQVLQSGGDCSDKSRLLSAMLKQIGIRSTLVMLYPCRICQPEHTVVEAEYVSGWMVVDPVYNLWFPKAANEYYGTYYFGLTDLINAPELLPERLQYLRNYRGANDKINRYNDSVMHYNYPRTINWDRNYVTRHIGNLIGMYPGHPYLMRRPYVMEDPKLVLTLAFLLISICLLLLSILFYRAYKPVKPD